jgi:hypothetical protein
MGIFYGGGGGSGSGSGSAWTYGSQVATTSGTTVVLSAAIPSTVVEIEIMLTIVSTSANDQPPIVQIGDTDGYDTTGYEYIDMNIAAGGMYADVRTDGFATLSRRAGAYTAAEGISGTMTLTRWDSTEHLWLARGEFYDDNTHGEFGSGHYTLSAALDRIRLTTPGGVATFDAGEARLRYR